MISNFTQIRVMLFDLLEINLTDQRNINIRRVMALKDLRKGIIMMVIMIVILFNVIRVCVASQSQDIESKCHECEIT